jgi:hypothetical protein
MKTIMSIILFVALNGVSQVTNWQKLIVNGQSYSNARIVKATPADALIAFDGGMVQLPMEQMPKETQTFFTYDPVKASTYREEQKALRLKIANQQRAFQSRSSTAKSAQTNELSISWKNHPTYMTGYVTNNTDRSLSFVSVEFEFVSESVQLGRGIEYTTHLSPRGTWKFRIDKPRDAYRGTPRLIKLDSRKEDVSKQP